MDEKARGELIESIGNFKEKKVLVIGDSILDENEYGRAIGLSLETPTIKAEHSRTENSFGGAGNVVENILELGGRVSFITLLGNDSYSKKYNYFKHGKLNFLPVVEDNRKTTVKRRFWVERGNSEYKVFQLDHLDNRDIESTSRYEVIEFTKREIEDSDLVLLVDYRHGMLSRDLISDLKSLVEAKGKKAIASSQVSQRGSNHLDYKGIYMMCLNGNEARAVYSEFDGESLSDLPGIFDSNVCVTLGREGSMMYLDGKEYRADGIDVEEMDSCGAGDCFLAALSLCDIEKEPRESLYISNCWAGLSVGKIGTEPPRKQELIDYIGGGS